MICPRCGHELEGVEEPGEVGATAECPACGVILAKALLRSDESLRPARRSTVPRRGERISRLGKAERRELIAGLALGLAAWALPFTRYAFSYALTVFHELGHTVVGWAFGYPTVPTFDFAYGGGMSIQLGRSLPLTIVAGGLVAFLAWRLRSTRAFAPAVALAALYVLAALTPLHDALVIAAGHGAELLLAGVCLFRALAPRRWPAAERGTYAATAAFVLAADARFGWQLLASTAFRRSYEQAKGGGHWMDLSRLAEDFLGADLAVVSVAFCLAVLFTPIAAHLAATNEARLGELLHLRPARE